MSIFKEFKSAKQRIFNKFSTNLDYLFQNWPNAEIIIPEGSGYVCPVGFTMHSMEGLQNSYDDQLTLEHIPPEALGGKPICLVRKDINSRTGHTIDKALMEQINAQSFLKGDAPIKGKVFYNLPGLKHITTDITIQQREATNILFNPGEKNMVLLKNQVYNKGLWDGLKMNMTFKLPNKTNVNRVAFLKYAYLLAFSKVGYALLFGPKHLINPHYNLVRKQILEPKEEIIPFIPIIKNVGPRIEGLGVVVDPEELKSLFVTFSLTWLGNTDYYTVFLPAPDVRGFSAYDSFERLRRLKKNFSFKFHEIQTYDFSNSKKEAIKFHKIWNDLSDN